MITQYNESYSVPSDVQEVTANRISLLDKYILIQTGKNEYTALIAPYGGKTVTKLVFSRTDSGYYNGYYTVSESETTDFEYTITNECAVYSNQSLGRSLTLPVYQGVTAWSLIIIAVTMMFAMVFKGALFKCLRKKR